MIVNENLIAGIVMIVALVPKFTNFNASDNVVMITSLVTASGVIYLSVLTIKMLVDSYMKSNKILKVIPYSKKFFLALIQLTAIFICTKSIWDRYYSTNKCLTIEGCGVLVAVLCLIRESYELLSYSKLKVYTFNKIIISILLALGLIALVIPNVKSRINAGLPVIYTIVGLVLTITSWTLGDIEEKPAMFGDISLLPAIASFLLVVIPIVGIVNEFGFPFFTKTVAQDVAQNVLRDALQDIL